MRNTDPKGWATRPPTEIIEGHELGHAAGAKDDGPNHMNNVNQNENPIRRDLGLPDRTEY